MAYPIVWRNPQNLPDFEALIYPVPQKAPHVSPWYGVYKQGAFRSSHE